MKMADKIADAQTVEPESSSSDRLAHVIQDDHDLGQSIISGARGYGVTIQPGHSAVLAIAQHRRKHSKASEDARIEFQEALQIIAAGHGCPSALARDVLDRVAASNKNTHRDYPQT